MKGTEHGITHLNIWTFILWFAHLRLFLEAFKGCKLPKIFEQNSCGCLQTWSVQIFLELSAAVPHHRVFLLSRLRVKIYENIWWSFEQCPKHLFATLCTSFNQMLFVVMETHCNESHVTHENLSQPTKFAVFKYFSMFLFSYSLNSISRIVQATYGKGLVFFLFSKDDLRPTSSRKRPAKCVDVIRSTLISFYTTGAAERSLKAASLSLLFLCWERIQLGLMWIGNREYPCLASELLKKATPTPWAQAHFFTFILG